MRKLTLAAAAAVLSAGVFASAGSAAVVPILSVYQGGAGTYTVQGTVTAQLDVYNGNNTFTVQDPTGGIIAYSIPESIYTANPGDNITITATDTQYQDAPEFKNTNPPLAVTVNSTGTGYTPPVVGVPAVSSSASGGTNGSAVGGSYAEEIVTLDDVYLSSPTTVAGVTTYSPVTSLATKTTYALSDLPLGQGNVTYLYTYTTYSNVGAAVTSANSEGAAVLAGPLDITGYVDPSYGTAEIYPLSITPAPEPASLGMLALASVGLLARRRRLK